MTPQTPSLPENLTQRLRQIRDLLLQDLVERDVAIRLGLLAALAGEHLLLVGPPGTAKSLLARRLRLAFRETTYFERLLTRFTVPEELFGPLSIRGLEEDRYERLTDKYLPWASVAFLDEIFKANSAILNALLTLLNEREFDNGARREKTPLLAVIGASNELPSTQRTDGDGTELDALFDRFLLRLHVGYVSGAGFSSLLGLSGDRAPVVAEELKLSAEDLRAIQETAEQVVVPADALALLRSLRDFCTAQKIPVSDRRWRKVKKLLQVSALSNGRDAVSIWDAWLLQHCLWDTPEQREQVYKWYAERVGASAAMDPSRLTKIVVSWEAKLKVDKESRSQMRDKEGRPLYRKPDGQLTLDTEHKAKRKRGKELLFLAPSETHTGGGYYSGSTITDRTNGGKGFTKAELDRLQLANPWISFSEWNRRAAYLADQNNHLLEDAELPAAMEPTRHKPQYLAACLKQIDQVRADIDRYRESLNTHQRSLEHDIQTHLWVTADFVEPAVRSLKDTASTVESLSRRINEVKSGFELLPRESDALELGAEAAEGTSEANPSDSLNVSQDESSPA
jgi:MoxR-like ATPase